MFRSIRWRLVASYVLLTLLTVTLVGVLALSLIERYLEQQERDYLTANAEAVARQAQPLLQPTVRPSDLRELASTASFLGNVQVRILDDHQRVLADSGSPAQDHEFIWIMTSLQVDVQSPVEARGTSIMVLPGGQRVAIGTPWREQFDIFEQLPPGTEFTFVRRMEGPWGNRFVFFGPMQELEVMRTPPVSPDGVPLPEPLPEPLPGPLAHEVAARSARVVNVPIGEGGEPLGYVELSRGPDFVARALATARRAFLSAAGGATLLAVIVGLLVGRGLTAPLRDLTVATGQMSGGDLSIRAPVRGKDEIGQLARQFNHMAERLEASFAELAAERDSLRRFIADASHELRTPITALKNFNELLQGAAAHDPAARDEFLAESRVQLDRLEWIVHNLLDLSRLEAGLAALDVARHDVGELIEVAASGFKTLAHERGVALSVELPSSPLEVSCDRARIELALSNLIDNALKFTPAGGRVMIGAGRAGADESLVRMWVQDSGPGIAPEDQPRIFERFYRGQGDRSEGTGLGLAIVRSIVQAHGGRVAVESERGSESVGGSESVAGQGSRFVIELPLAGPDGES